MDVVYVVCLCAIRVSGDNSVTDRTKKRGDLLYIEAGMPVIMAKTTGSLGCRTRFVDGRIDVCL